MIHRDIKPGNLWLEGSSGRVKILDFGLARLEGETAGLSQSGALTGTPAYMSPEQANAHKIDARCDLFSLGSVLYRICTGKIPFKGRSFTSILLSICLDEPTSVQELNPQVPAALANVIHRLLEKDPAKRFQTAIEVVEALRDVDQPPRQPGPAIIRVEPMPTVGNPAAENVWSGIDDSSDRTLEVKASGRTQNANMTSTLYAWIISAMLVFIGVAVMLAVLLPV